MRKIVIGAEENLTLPSLGLTVTARIDTGAKTSALHVERLEIIEIEGKRFVQFDIESAKNTSEFAFCLPLLALRKIKSSNGNIELRPVIKTHLMINHHRWNIELTLTNRDSMTYLMLLGREAMGKRVLVDPSVKHLLKQSK